MLHFLDFVHCFPKIHKSFLVTGVHSLTGERITRQVPAQCFTRTAGFCLLTEVYFTYRETHPFQVCNSVALNIFTKLCHPPPLQPHR